MSCEPSADHRLSRSRYLLGVKYSQVKAALEQERDPLFLERSCTLRRARRLVGGREDLELLRKAGWLKPVREGKRKTTFNQRQVHEAYARITREGHDALIKAAA